MTKIQINTRMIGLTFVLTLIACLAVMLVIPTEVLTQGKELSGAEVYSANCGKCHSERYPSERTDDEWQLIVSHMRVRAGLTAKEARAVLEYLQENND